jgi:WD40 repeat protein
MAHLLCEARPPRRGDSGSGRSRQQYDTPITWLRKAIRLWDTSTGRKAGVLSGHRLAVNDVAFSPDGLRLVSGGDDGTIRVWDAERWQPVPGANDTAYARFSDDGRRIESGSDDGTALWWDATTMRPIGERRHVGDNDVQTLFPVGENRLLSLGSANTVQLWDARTRTSLSKPLRLPSDAGGLFIADRNADRIAATIEPGAMQVHNTATMEPVGAPIKQGEPVTAIALSDDGRILATASEDFTLRLWDADKGTAKGQPMAVNWRVTSITFSRDGNLLAAGDVYSTLQLWDTQGFKRVGYPMAWTPSSAPRRSVMTGARSRRAATMAASSYGMSATKRHWAPSSPRTKVQCPAWTSAPTGRNLSRRVPIAHCEYRR